jgi:hypothetical protein
MLPRGLRRFLRVSLSRFEDASAEWLKVKLA